MSMAKRMVQAEFEELLHLSKDGRELEARGLQAVAVECQLTPGAVVSTVVTVQGQVVDAMGQPVAGVFDVVLKTYSTHASNMTAAGTPVGTIKTGSGSQEVWMQTSSTGAFAIASTDTTGGELALMKAEVGDGITAMAELQF